MAKHWTLTDIWNDSFIEEDEPVRKRNHLHASELGNSFIDIWYKLRGTPYTNTFTDAARRKMEAGKLFEGIIRMVLKRAGILKKAQVEANHQLNGMLAVHGRLDFLAGGKVDLVQAEECLAFMKKFYEELEFPKIYQKIAEKAFEMVKDLAGKTNVPLWIYILELKSVADFVYRLIEDSPRPLNSHHIQIYHYLFALDMKGFGKVDYINRDDVRIMEKKVYRNEQSHKEYASWIEQMTDYANDIVPPPKEQLIIYHKDTGNFAKNTTGVEWSKYLTLIYGYKTTQDFRDHVMPLVKSWNYTMDRCVKCSTMTAENLKAIQAAKTMFPNWDELVDWGKYLAQKKMPAV
jgi:hypothetical protein